MTDSVSEFVSIQLSRDEALVLFGYFWRVGESDTVWLDNNAEFCAFSKFSAQLDKVLVEPFQSDYQELLAAARDRVSGEYDGLAPGVRINSP